MKNFLAVVGGIIAGVIIALLLIYRDNQMRAYPRTCPDAQMRASPVGLTAEASPTPDEKPWWKPDAVGVGVGIGFGAGRLIFPMIGAGVFFWWLLGGRR